MSDSIVGIVLDSPNPEKVKAEYISLRGVYLGMVGNLYPMMCYDKLLDLRDKYSALKGGKPGEWHDLPYVCAPVAGRAVW